MPKLSFFTQSIKIRSDAFCLDKNIQQIEAAIKQGLGQTPSELYADIVERGI